MTCSSEREWVNGVRVRALDEKMQGEKGNGQLGPVWGLSMSEALPTSLTFLNVIV